MVYQEDNGYEITKIDNYDKSENSNLAIVEFFQFVMLSGIFSFYLVLFRSS